MPNCSTQAALALRNLGVDYRTGFWRTRRPALNGLDLQLERGAQLGLIGPNGAGKSTLLKVCAGRLSPARGQIEVLGADPGRAATRRAIGYLPEDDPYPPELSAAAALRLAAGLNGMGGRELRDACRRMLAAVGLEHQARTPLGRFSKGMLRRFGLAQAWIHEPDLLLLDEPTSGLDAEGFCALEELLDHARRRGASWLLSSHHAEDVERHCSSAALLAGGRLLGRGTLLELAGEESAIELELEGLTPAALVKLEAYVQELGGRVLRKHGGAGALLALYRRSSN